MKEKEVVMDDGKRRFVMTGDLSDSPEERLERIINFVKDNPNVEFFFIAGSPEDHEIQRVSKALTPGFFKVIVEQVEAFHNEYVNYHMEQILDILFGGNNNVL